MTSRMVRQTAAARPPDIGASENGSLPEALVESYRRLADVFHHVLSEQSLDALLDRIVVTLGELMPFEALHIYEVDEERRELIPVLARSQAYEDEIMCSRPRFGEGITGWAVENRSPVWTNHAHLDPRVVNVPGTPVEPEALITVPLIARGALKGALNIYRIGENAGFAEHEFELAKWFADAVALAIDNAQIRARLEHLAQTDSLTGLYNHRFFHERLRSELTRASRSRDSVAVLMFDLDDFKRVNDIYGHGAGDQLLTHLARVARETVRGSDVVCRIGGEEFGVIMPSCDAGDALGLAARFTERLRTIEFEPAGLMTVSIGVSQGPQHAMNPRELVACAEAAMMTAKARGKNQCVVYDDGPSERPEPGAVTAARDVRSIGHMKMLQSLAGKLNRLNDVREIGRTIATELRLLIDYHNCRVVLRDGDDLRPVTFVGDHDAKGGSAADAYTTSVGVGITGRVVETGESLLIPNALECEFAYTIPGTAELEESLAAVPLRYGSRVTGAIVISKLGLNQFDDDDVRLLEVLAGQASVALENARLYEQQRLEAEYAKALLAFADVVSRAHTVEEICTQTVHTALSLFETGAASLWLGEECVASEGPPLSSGVSIDLGEDDGLTGRLVLGVASLDENRRRLLASFAYQTSAALQKVRLYLRQLEAAEIANALLEASREFATAESPEEVLGRSVRVTARVLGAEQVVLWLQEDGSAGDLVARASCGYAADSDPANRRRYPGVLAREWLDSRAGPFVLEPSEVASLEGVAPEHVGRYVIAPVRLDGSRVGALVATIGDRELHDRQLRLLAGLAHQAKLAIESVEHYESLERTFVSTVASLANALEANDAYTSLHARWITDMAVLVGRELRLDRAALKRLELGALFHDIGKIGIPSEILHKPGPLTDEEFAIVREHPELGERILAPIDRFAEVCPIVRACHEQWDGLGYPDGKCGTEIPVEARIVLVCDAFHAMVTDRPYRARLSAEEAIRRLRASAGTQFEPAVVDTFVRLFEAGDVPDPE
ncbi:MAG TPA: diguanylate cyclase [Gaiellaceae bacterium]|nr:diguanylate cyclase [Gaiellaceae bacterium]